MNMLADVVSHLLVAYVVLAWPWRGRRRYRALQNELNGSAPGARIDVYRRMLLHQAAIVLVVVIILWAGSIPRDAVGLVMDGTQVRLVFILLAIIGISGLFFRWKGDRFVKRMLELAAAILPATAIERLWFAALSIGAGV